MSFRRHVAGSANGTQDADFAIAPERGKLASRMIDLIAEDRLEDALSMFQAQRSKANAFCYNLMLSALSNAGDVAGMKRVYDQMRESPVRPDEETAMEMLAGLPTLPEKLDFYEQWMADGMLEQPSIRLFNSVLVFLIEEGHIFDAQRRFDEMASARLEPDATTYDVLIAGYAQRASDPESPDDVKRLHDDMVRRGLRPSTTVLVWMIMSRGKLARLEEAKDFFKLIGERGEHSSISYFALMEAYMFSNQLDDMLKCFDEMQAAGFQAEYNHYELVARAFAETDDVDKLAAWVDKMKAAGYAPQSVVYSCLMYGHMNRGDKEAVVRVHNEMEQAGVAADTTARDIMMDALLATKGADAALKYINDSRAKAEFSARSYAFALEALRKEGRNEEVMELLKTMKQRGVEPDAYGYAVGVLALTYQDRERVPDFVASIPQELHPEIATILNASHSQMAGGDGAKP